ncbi:MAG: hypothetical protein GKR89_26655 [Candidatus Latescibacteria bacterium]|nr:hypothetical protein [Candidatus Latescibacterota bacterium]
MEHHFRQLDEQGYTILEDLLTPEQVAEAIEALALTYREEGVSDHEPGSLRTHNLTARAEIFRQIIQLPRLVACMEYLLGDDYILSDMGARSPQPGMQPQALHRDGGAFVPNPPQYAHRILPTQAQSMFALSQFTRENGASRIVPGSHLRDIDGASVPAAEERLLLCRPGTVTVFDNRLLHGGDANTTDQIRYAIQGFCCRRIIRPFCDHTRSTPADLVERASPLLRRLWGFEVQSAWEQSQRDFRIVKAPDARPIFDYNRS